jgi:hypothetical protein
MSEMTNLKSDPSLYVERCCEGADIVRTFEQWGIAWPDGVRRWNGNKTVACHCAECGRELEFERRRASDE